MTTMDESTSRKRPPAPTREGAPPITRVEEHPYRSMAKAISWRVTGTLDTMLISYLITGSLAAAASIGFLEVFTKMVLYYFHERLWSKTTFGRRIREEKPPINYEI